MDQPLRATTRPSRAAPDRFGWAIGVSVALHAAALVGLAFIPRHLTQATEAPAVELVMLPVEAETAPAPQPAPAPEPTPRQEAHVDQPPVPQPPPPQVEPTPPEPAPPPQVTPPPTATAEAPPPEPLPEPPPEPPPPPRVRTVVRRPPAPPRPARAAAAPVPETSQPAAEAPALPPVSPGPPEPREAPARLDPSWLAGVGQWLLAHRSYPEMARELGRQGTVVVQITVDPDGSVRNVKLMQGSGSESLDQAAQALVRNAHLPPFPPDMKLPQQTVTLPIRYRLE